MAALELALSITDLEVGGAEQCLVELAARLDRARFHPVVYCLGARPEVDEASCVPALEAAGIEVHCLEGGGLSSAPRVLGQLTRLFRQHRPDVVQTFLFHANMLGRVAARRAARASSEARTV